ncbi:hypothetical protein [Aliarcobacter butzleri]|uniref:Lipoprotein n=2 Tax=Aliarcobacter butzleri TaxID=28197 RepID=A0A837J8Y1_9BACT|nr:hypothetical protein [Aliarcobacter butzleri]KLE02928.1 hypothetical protein AF76_00250 [Aliarcobacter butzleri L351]KLE14046.1 hypothetical protein AF75_00955 [Aliarcobacter butzleri L350]MDN5107571.1 hypothetical protein [Aliarcobacter butzleri]MDN5122895.1 hypothetical protein [Aliarcobacter butzleri]
MKRTFLKSIIILAMGTAFIGCENSKEDKEETELKKAQEIIAKNIIEEEKLKQEKKNNQNKAPELKGFDFRIQPKENK